ncbi:putative protein argonaute [Helianthus annuus]|nr:putative protein argonaute [Helianthus annuus]
MRLQQKGLALQEADIFLRGYGGWNSRQAVQVLDELFPKVAISPEVISKTKCQEIMKLLCESFKASHLGNLMLAYDGKKSAFAAGSLPFELKEFVVNITERNGWEREFKVTIKFAAKKDLRHLKMFLTGSQHDSPQETIQALESLDVVLRESASNDREVIGRSLFSPVFGKGTLGDGIEYWKGFYLGMSLVPSGTKSVPVPKEPVLKILKSGYRYRYRIYPVRYSLV